MKRLLAILMTLMPIASFAQTDTTVIYIADYEETSKDSADTYIEFYKQDSVWHGKQYYMKNAVLKSEGNYKEKNISKKMGSFKTYSEKGILKSIESYSDSSKALDRTYFYENGNKRSWIKYVDAFKNDTKCWDQAGNEVPGCIVEKPALFKGGAAGWSRFLERTLDAGVAVKSGAPTGRHTVIVQFTVDKEGAVSRIKPVGIPPLCKRAHLKWLG